ncbi:TolC family protein [Sphingomonas piscis]|uniref:TolC family protein n=1 Tax=Sphingomonas piscis TaxID=2714943 RepID=A0A6G7YQP1_9SPHN|nr:TolC family protein [Sphingomonas piscis]QIK79060.1 TolC family protein [Sphingomonas piscis]
MTRILLASAGALALAACATGPTYQAKQVAPAAAAPFIGDVNSTLVSSAQPDQNWWRLYNDPVLDRLVADALAANTDIRVAEARLARARALLREERGAREPQIGVGGGVQYQRTPGPEIPGQDRSNIVGDVGADVSYEVDLFGRIGRRVEAARGDVAASAADADAVRVLIVADTTRAYADAVAAAEQAAVAQRIVDLLNRSLSLTQRRKDVGLGNGLDVARIAGLRDQRLAEIPLYLAERQAALFRLATLTGRAPRELPVETTFRTSSLKLDRPIPVGDGALLLARRPDVRAAERRLAAATARIGVATADLYPRISLGGSVGATNPIGDLFTGNALSWVIGPLLNWTVNRTAARARIAGAEADAQAALAQFDGTVLGALEETETSLSRYQQSVARRTALAAARNQAEAAARIARARQREGDISSLELIDAERTVADAQAQLALADAAITEAQIALFRALGGSWQA